MKYLSGFLFFFISLSRLFATHIEAGEITYRQINGFTYEATLVLYVLKSSNVPGGQVDNFSWGDGSTQTLNLSSEILLADGLTQKRTYIASHTYPGPSRYLLSVNEQYRINSIQNINSGGGINVAFYLESELIIDPFNPTAGGLKNNSPILANPPLDKACIFQRFEHNPSAYDIDGDSLSYQLVPCRGEGGVPIVYVDPDQVVPGPANKISIDAITGTLTWESAQLAGVYNVAILITEWRNGKKVGSVLRDMQITVINCSNKPPLLPVYQDTCVYVNANINKIFTASDINDASDMIFITATGETFDKTVVKSMLSNAQNGNPASVNFSWVPTCAEVRPQPYEVVVKASDNGNRPLSDYSTWRIKVIAPPVNVYPPQVQNGVVQINWDASICSNVSGYRVYRAVCNASAPSNGCGFQPVPGYDLLGTVEGNGALKFVDSTLSFSSEACYFVVPYFTNGALGDASNQVCVSSPFQELCSVSVGRTSATNGIDTVRWNRPVQIDTLTQFVGPYYYKVFRVNGISKATTQVGQTPGAAMLWQCDTVFVDSLINTQDSIHTYRVELFSGSAKVGSSSNASSVFLTAEGNDRRVKLKWTSRTPWEVRNTFVQRFDSTLGSWITLFVSGNFTEYVDNALTNGRSYCYRIVTFGEFCDTNRSSNEPNYSQVVCAQAVDLSPPPAPQLGVASYCKDGYAEFTWDNNPNFDNADLKHYVIFYAPNKFTPLTELEILPRTANIYTYVGENKTIGGCYAIGTVDSLGNKSGPSFPICLEDCPDYRLPNVFTPNGDGVNDVFKPFPYQGVISFNIQIYNRWGGLVFETTNPDINWDGTSSGKTVSDGVYFYVGQVKLNSGAVEPVAIELKGSVSIFTEKTQGRN